MVYDNGVWSRFLYKQIFVYINLFYLIENKYYIINKLKI